MWNEYRQITWLRWLTMDIKHETLTTKNTEQKLWLLTVLLLTLGLSQLFNNMFVLQCQVHFPLWSQVLPLLISEINLIITPSDSHLKNVMKCNKICFIALDWVILSPKLGSRENSERALVFPVRRTTEYAEIREWEISLKWASVIYSA